MLVLYISPKAANVAEVLRPFGLGKAELTEDAEYGKNKLSLTPGLP